MAPMRFFVCTILVAFAACGGTDPEGCGPGTHLDGDRCAADTVCGSGTHAEGASCAPDYAQVTCAAGTRAENGSCVPAYPQIECGPGTTRVGGECELAQPVRDCGPGTVLRNDTCVSLTLQQMGLPFVQGATVSVSQAFHGSVSHKGASIYAVDFPTPEGTQVAAARAGRVWGVREDSTTGCGTESCAADANYLIVDHGDGTFGKYWHLRQNGALVAPGDTVCKGQIIAQSGNTGWSTAPHLHFEVGDLYHQSLPLRFDEMTDTAGHPFAGGSFQSQNSQPSACTEGHEFAECPAGVFAHMGIVVDPGFPCAVAARDRAYTLSGKSFGTSPKILVSGYNGASWEYTCITRGSDGRFTTNVTFPAGRYTSFAFFMVSVATAGCVSVQGWSASPKIVLQ